MNLNSNLSLFGSLLVVGSLGGCGGYLRSLEADRALSAPGPTRTVQLPPMAASADGTSYYGRVPLIYDRGTARGTVPVAAQLQCPPGQSISGICGVSRQFADGSRDDAAYSVFQGICYDPSSSSVRGFDPCTVGALFCGTQLSRSYDAEGEDSGRAEATSATFTFSVRCAPTSLPRP